VSGEVLRELGEAGEHGVAPARPHALAGVALAVVVEVEARVLQQEPGDTITLTVRRGERTLRPELTLGTRPTDSAS